ncbi:MAG: bifunctional diguanylate cyclase/phosphodiesterase, partial [Candidatus Competibacteraceae bacterium]|nr:bifunctional diguanylate cyclase/phosphodiesterase [Candidatus Competibacteraceae bacterium]
LLLSCQWDLDRHLAALGVGGDDLLSKPIDDNYLYGAVACRLRRFRVLDNKLQTLSQRDPISGLYNRRHFLDQLERGGAGLGITTRSLAVMLIRLDNLRALGDDTDVVCADRLVEMAARRLQGVLGQERQPARFADAFFAVQLENTDEEQLWAIARTVRQVLEGDGYPIGERTLSLRTTVGACLVARPEKEIASLIHHADSACSIARQAQGERIHVHNLQAEGQVREDHRVQLLQDIREAIEKQRMGLVFQPIVSLRGDQAERYEVFLRMGNDQGQELLPESVFAVAQSHRLGVALDRWVIAHSISLLRERQSAGRNTILFINVSLATLEDKSFPIWLQRGLNSARMDPRDLVFEVSQQVAEGHIMALGRFLAALRTLGCSFSLERFGRRPDSIGLLRELAADYVKLDVDFVQSLMSSAGQQDQLKRLVAQLNGLHATTIVGGIENLYTLPVLWACGVNYVQGYFLQRPHREMSYDFTGNLV